jgi:hypothetical protein
MQQHKAPETPAVAVSAASASDVAVSNASAKDNDFEAASDKIIQLYDKVAGIENNNMITDDLKSKMLARYQQEINTLQDKYFK